MVLVMSSLVIPFDAGSAFHFRHGAEGKPTLDLLVLPPGSRGEPTAIWSRRFDNVGDREAMIEMFDEGKLDAVFLGRLTMTFGSAAIDEVMDDLAAKVRADREEELEEEAQRVRDHLVVFLYTPKNKSGRYILKLQRKSSDKAEWSVAYDRQIERDRLCDWLIWQENRFLEFLDHVEKHGGEALTRLMVNEMFVTERRVKKEGRGAGGMRPLRMWRGD